ncbi:CDP-alcohol phosphatidyltransferase family protein [Dietzia sp. 179-F 9C3 NHS]|uniref:CDP-alcohol phosphatidyltransferase family protein n=1 Tax=Dietzia sp. 179-F 9C3 NHS TaxID=3374295 RepID=UPI00387A4BB0
MNQHGASGTDRREIPQRTTTWATRAADVLERVGATPNLISVGSVVVAVVAAAALVASADASDAARAGLLVLAAVCLPLRLLMNMLDGMLAVEKGMHSPVGDLYNEVPDRFSDVAVLAAAGYATAGAWTGAGHDLGVALGWTAAVLAVLTAYARALGAAGGVGQVFAGPMAKPRRMWVVVAACAVSLLEPALGMPRGWVFVATLAVVALGSAVTTAVRLRVIARDLTARAAGS